MPILPLFSNFHKISCLCKIELFLCEPKVRTDLIKMQNLSIDQLNQNETLFTKKCFIKFTAWGSTSLLLTYYTLCLMVQIFVLVIIFWKKKTKSLAEKLLVIHFVSSICSVLVYSINCSYDMVSKCIVLKINYIFTNSFTKTNIISLAVILRENLCKMQNINTIQTNQEKRQRRRESLAILISLFTFAITETTITVTLESKLAIGIGILYDLFLNVASLVYSYKAYTVNTIDLPVNHNQADRALRRTMTNLKGFQRITLCMTVISSTTKILNIIMMTIIGLGQFPTQQREFLMYISRVYVLGISIKTALYIYMNRKTFFKKARVENSTSSNFQSANKIVVLDTTVLSVSSR